MHAQNHPACRPRRPTQGCSRRMFSPGTHTPGSQIEFRPNNQSPADTPPEPSPTADPYCPTDAHPAVAASPTHRQPNVSHHQSGQEPPGLSLLSQYPLTFFTPDTLKHQHKPARTDKSPHAGTPASRSNPHSGSPLSQQSSACAGINHGVLLGNCCISRPNWIFRATNSATPAVSENPPPFPDFCLPPLRPTY